MLLFIASKKLCATPSSSRVLYIYIYIYIGDLEECLVLAHHLYRKSTECAFHSGNVFISTLKVVVVVGKWPRILKFGWRKHMFACCESMDVIKLSNIKPLSIFLVLVSFGLRVFLNAFLSIFFCDQMIEKISRRENLSSLNQPHFLRCFVFHVAPIACLIVYLIFYSNKRLKPYKWLCQVIERLKIISLWLHVMRIDKNKVTISLFNVIEMWTENAPRCENYTIYLNPDHSQNRYLAHDIRCDGLSFSSVTLKQIIVSREKQSLSLKINKSLKSNINQTNYLREST